jgi:hypothetical protein
MYPVNGSPRPFIIDLDLAKKIGRHNWNYVPRARFCHAVVRTGKPRVSLHHYIINVLGKRDWMEIHFRNGDKFDCRRTNLKPYDRSNDGANRRLFKNKKSFGKKGVYYRKKSKTWYAMIRFKGKMIYLGTKPTAEAAAKAYSVAFRQMRAKQFLTS